MKLKYPIYIISKGRWEKRLTSKMLERMKAPYRIVIEPSEFNKYARNIDEEKILVLPDDFSKLKKGSIPVRNWVWEHSIKKGFERHWIMDDNIRHVYRFNNNTIIKCLTKTPFCVIEDFVDRYTNIGQAGMQYEYFVPRGRYNTPIIFNTRVYSCILIKNDLPYRWRGKYNEDTDLSLRVLKDGLCTTLFNAFLIDKERTNKKPKGGNREIYDKTNNRLEFAKSLQRQHPDVVKIVKKYKRWHHLVDYKPFKYNLLIKKTNVNIPNMINNFGMKLVKNN